METGMKRVLIIGGGAAGMAAAVFAARSGVCQVEVFEKNEKLGKKLFITGKGRCNVTNACDTEELFTSVRSNPKFLYSAFYGFTNQDAMQFFEDLGVPLKVERGNRVFPVSDHSSDIIRGLENEMKLLQVQIHLRAEVTDIIIEETRFHGIRLKDGRVVCADACVVATGGCSYQATGSTGDGYRFAGTAGHQVTKLSPSIVPMEVKEDYVKRLQGLSLKNVQVTITAGKKELYSDFGEMLFTHYGVSGPLILSGSSYITNQIGKDTVTLSIDLKPALTQEQLDHRILRDFEENRNRDFKNSLGKLFPAKLIPVIVALSGIPEEKKVHEISREERQQLVRLIKHLTMTVTGLRGYQEAIITRGGVNVKEINPSTMESRKTQGLYFIGEVLDLDAVTGGFNLQIAWSTAYTAAQGITAAAKDGPVS